MRHLLSSWKLHDMCLSWRHLRTERSTISIYSGAGDRGSATKCVALWTPLGLARFPRRISRAGALQTPPRVYSGSAALFGAVTAGKQRGAVRTLKDESSFKGEGMNHLKLDILYTGGHRSTPRNVGARCQVAGSAAPGDSAYGINDYLPNFTDKSLPLKIRAACFYLWTYCVAAPLFLVMVALQPFVLLLDRNRRKAQHFVNRIWALLTISLFYKAEIVGSENLPSANEPAVYVANHQSFLDIYTLFLLGRPFKFISKTSNFLIPVIGWAMYLTGHVPLRRQDKRSQLECLKKCIELVKNGVPVLFFPEGTRSSDGKMAAFKKGAFTIATKGHVPVVPISLIGTGRLMPNGLEDTLRPGKVKVIIHPPLRGDNPDILCNQTREVIGQSLLKHGMPVL